MENTFNECTYTQGINLSCVFFYLINNNCSRYINFDSLHKKFIIIHILESLTHLKINNMKRQPKVLSKNSDYRLVLDSCVYCKGIRLNISPWGIKATLQEVDNGNQKY
jgi:hypothetical protein